MSELFRVTVYDENHDKILETTEPTEFYTEAHIQSFDWDPDYPNKLAFVEASDDEGVTWKSYNSSRSVNGAPAWVNHNAKWRKHKAYK